MDKRYTLKEIQRIINDGSVGEKAKLYLRDRIGYFDSRFILSFGQPEELSKSVSPDDREIWEDLVSYGLRLENGLRDLLRLVIRIQSEKSGLSHSLIERVELEQYQDLLNDFLLVGNNGDPTDIETQRKIRVGIIQQGLRNKHFTLTRPTIGEDGFINLNLDKGDGRFKTLREHSEDRLESLRGLLTEYLCYETAMRRRIKESNLRLPEYENLLKGLRENIDQPVSSMLRFVGVQDERLFQIGECHLKDGPKGNPYPAMSNLIEDFSLRIEDIDLNKEEQIERINQIYKQI